MTRAEILSEIKKAEEDAKSLVAEALEAKTKKLSEAHVQSREIIRKAEEESLKYAESEISKAQKKIQKERDKIIEKGTADAEEIKNKAKENIPEATGFILMEFERAVNA